MKLESVDKLKHEKKKTPLLILLVPLLILLLVIGVLVRLHETEQPQIAFKDLGSPFGASGEVTLSLADAKSGLRSLQAVMVQGATWAVLFEKRYPRQGLLFQAGPARAEETFAVAPRDLGFTDGPAQLLVTVRDYSWWRWRKGNETTVVKQVLIDTKPPLARITASPTYIKAGGAGLVLYRLNEPVREHGVTVNDRYHRGFPLPALGEGAYGALIGMPYDLERIEAAYVSAVDEAGNTGRTPVGMILRRLKPRHDRINISDSFLNRKLPEFAVHYPELTGTPIEQYLVLNNRVRQENNDRIRSVCSQSVPDKLWQGAFMRMARSSRRSSFADYRTYYYNGREVDKQVHLGIDLASTKHAVVEAANRGKVVFAEYLGIYGNTVILDHGMGLFSLYSHLSQIDVSVGDLVDKQGRVGLSGMSGMAGGDHLHFAMLVNGVFVNPLEWWDRSWVAMHVEGLLPK